TILTNLAKREPPAATEARASTGVYRLYRERPEAGRAFEPAPTSAPAARVDLVSVEGRQADRIAPPLAVADVAPSMVIRTGRASIEVDSLEPAVDLVRHLAARLGGHVANTSMQTGSGQLRSASLELKLPAGRFDEALTGLQPIGKVESVDVQAQDVGEEYVDVTARVTNARRLEQRLITILATRTGKLQDVLEVEQALARVREEIERYEGRLRYLRTHVATSTLTVYLHEPVPVVGRVGSSVMGEAFKQAWRNFVGLLALVIQSLGILIPLGALAAGGWYAYRWWGKRRTT
ncbi:MAG: DUF4349 domain-containing protein, partial [Gemmatimonadales bacterium]